MPESSWTLAVTCRCLTTDLGFSNADCNRPLTKLVDRHRVLADFVTKRSNSPTGGETIQALLPTIVAYSLHSGRYRGVTWHHERAGIVWLLAVGWHEQGSRQDAYLYFEQLLQAGTLLPTREDVARVVARRRLTFEGALLEEVPRLRAAAIAQSGMLVAGAIGGRIRVRLVYEDGCAGLLSLAVANHLMPGELRIPEEWMVQVLAAFFPGVPLAQIGYCEELSGHTLDRDEICFCALVPG